MLERALALDPKFAAARGQYAFASMIPVYFGEYLDPGVFYKAEEEARQALRDDPTCAVAHSALAGIYLSLGCKELVPGEADKALQTNSRDPAIHLWFPLYNRANGDYQQAIHQMKEIITRDPTFGPARFYYGQTLHEHGDTPGAVRELEQLLEQAPGPGSPHWSLARVYMDSGDLPSAREAAERVDLRQRQLPWSRLTWALLLARESKNKEALQEIDEQTLAWAAASYLGPLLAAEVYAVVGDTAKALDWMDRAVRWGDEREEWFRRDPALASLRSNPRFQQLLASVTYRRQQRSSSRPQSH
jgi:tetratricopeptide (TPR) repeat protein